jgi:hypothetical protein
MTEKYKCERERTKKCDVGGTEEEAETNESEDSREHYTKEIA